MNLRKWKKLDLSSRARIAPTCATFALLLLVVCGCASVPKVPPVIRVPAEQKVVLHAYAKGVQIYVCEKISTDSGNFAWKLKAPEATLFEVCGSVVGSHYSGPTWEYDSDGSKVEGAELQRIDSPLPNAIPWLLVKAKSTGGPGRFHNVTYIQRVNTAGGLPPAAVPDKTQWGKEVRVPYTAEYVFYRATH